MKTARLTVLALLVSLALVLNIAEGTLPMPLPGIKLGAANVFTIAALVLFGAREAFAVTAARVLLAWLLTGNIFAFLCGMTGGLLSTTVMALIYTEFSDYFSLPSISVAGAWAFNIGQVTVAALLIGDLHVFYYLLPLLPAGTAAGWAVGVLAQLLADRLSATLSFKKGDLDG